MSRLVFVRSGASVRPADGDVVIPVATLREWGARAGPVRALMAYEEAAIATPELCQAGRPFALALVARLCARGRVSLVDDAGATRTIGASDLIRWAGQLSTEPFTKRALVRRTRERVERELASVAHRAPRRLDSSLPCAFFRTDLSFGVRAGGSVGHIAGVINNLSRLGFQPLFVTTDRVPTVDPVIETHLVCASARFWNYPELPTFVMDEVFGRTAGDLLSQRKVGFIYQRSSLNNFAGVRLAREHQVPLVLEYNGSEVWVSQHWGTGALTHRDLSIRIEDLNFAAADLIVVVSDAVRDELTARGVGAQKILVNPNGVDSERYSPSVDGSAVRRRLGLDPALVLGFIGTFGAWHGAEVLAAAYERLLARRSDLCATTRLVFIGDGPLLPRVRASVDAGAARGHVIFTGLVPQAEGPEYLAACDVLVSPHVPNSDGTPFFGSPTKLFEYMAMGRPIVASALDQIGQVLSHGESAWLVTPGDAEALSHGLERVVDDGALRRRLADRARADAVGRHSWRQHTQRIVDALAVIAGALPSAPLRAVR
jgi:glycosyltransferase involved in cell wall biosynthesis